MARHLEDDYAHMPCIGWAYAAAAERAAVVVYLDKRASQNGGDCWCFSSARDDIEDGKHRR